MDPVQQFLVADHIHELEHEAAALRAERARDVGARDGRVAPRGPAAGPRRRLGRWLIGVGLAIAGRPAGGVADASDPMTSPG